MKKNEQLSTFERMMQNPDFQAKFESGYQEFLLSELLISIMENDNISVEQLAQEVNLSSAVIQEICSGHQKDIKFSNFLQIVQACGYNLILEKGDDRIPVVL
jgi:DNA-binding Xre family transcriptional regulator